MKKIKCNFCHKTIEFDESKIRVSGKAELITCTECSRSITVGFGKDKYYDDKEDK